MRVVRAAFLPVAVSAVLLGPTLSAQRPPAPAHHQPTIAQFLSGSTTSTFARWFGPSSWAYIIGEALLIILFTYFYTAVTFNPIDQADNLKKYGGFVPGVRPGRPTAEYLDRILTRLTFPGALFLAAIAVLPYILFKYMNVNFYFGGTSLLIVVGVAMDTVQQVESQLIMRHYDGFMKKTRIRGRRG